MAVPTGRESDKFMLRLPDGMRERIKAAAEANSRSMNAEIVATLEEKYPAPVEEITMNELREWALDIAGARDERERLKRLREANKRLAAEPKWRGWELGTSPVRDQDGGVAETVVLFRSQLELKDPPPPAKQHQFKPGGGGG